MPVKTPRDEHGPLPSTSPGNVMCGCLEIAARQFDFYIKTSGVIRHVRVNGALANGAWHHVAGTWDRTTMAVYLDGNPVGSATPGGTLDAPTGAVTLRSSGEYLNGNVDEVRVWNVARTQAQIQASMRLNLAGNETGLIGYWRMDETSGRTAHDDSSSHVP